MKNLFLFNALIISGLSINAQNFNNVQLANIDNNINYQQVTNINSNPYSNVQTQGDRGGNAATLRNMSNNTNPVNQKKVVNNKPKKVVQTNVGNVFDNVAENNGNVIVQAPVQGNINRNINDVNINENSNPQINKQANNKPVVATTEYKGLDFKRIEFPDRDYNGGKLKKGQKNFSKPTISKPRKSKMKKKPSFKKVKHHTSKCARW